MGICTKFQPLGYQTSSGDTNRSFIKKIAINYLGEAAKGYFFLDREKNVWVFGSGLYAGTAYPIGNLTTPTRLFRNVKKLIPFEGVGYLEGSSTWGFVLFIGTDNKLYFYGGKTFTSVFGLGTSYTGYSTPIAILSDVKDAWVFNIWGKVTIYALTSAGKLYACGDNSNNQFGNNTGTSSQAWVEILDNVDKFVPVQNQYGQMFLFAEKGGGIYLSNYSASVTFAGQTYSDSYSTFREITINENETLLPDKIEGVIAPTYYSFLNGSSYQTYSSIGLVSKNVVYTNIGMGFAQYFGVNTSVEAKDIIRLWYGFAVSETNTIKYYAYSNTTLMPINDYKLTTLLDNVQISKLFSYDNGGYLGYLTSSGDLYRANVYNSSFSKASENVSIIQTLGTASTYCYIKDDNSGYYGTWGESYNSNIQLPAFNTTNTNWQN